MLHLFRKYASFRILDYFLNHPTQEIHLKELARKLNMSPRSIKIYCDEFEKEEIILCRRQGNLRLFSLNNENYVVREVKRAYMAALLRELGIDKLSEKAISIAVYGSHASGEYDERSDLDILVIGKEVDKKLLLNISKKLGKDVQLTIFPLQKWESIKNKDAFAKSILRNHILIGGAPL